MSARRWLEPIIFHRGTCCAGIFFFFFGGGGGGGGRGWGVIVWLDMRKVLSFVTGLEMCLSSSLLSSSSSSSLSSKKD